ncbi:MAG TPA: hypothetical protein VFU00_00945, partial [Gemmatimonadales bacterium]|nr:hypothetical protein [Gemmatimonadales bacterium]
MIHLPRGAAAPLSVLAALLMAGAPLAAQGARVPFTPGMVVTRSTAIVPGRYRIPAGDSSTAAIVVRGDGIALDMSGVELIGYDDARAPDRFTGVGVRIEGGRDVS